MGDTFRFPILRCGEVCETDRHLNYANAFNVATLLNRKFPEIKHHFENSLESVGGTQLKWSNEGVKQRLDRGPILDLPRMDFTLGEFDVSFHLSLTVCMYGMKSKLWSRMSCVRHKQRPATSLSYQVVRAYYDESHQCSRELLRTLRLCYKDALKEIGAASDIKVIYVFNIRAANSPDPDLEDLLKELSGGERSLTDSIYTNPKHYSAIQSFVPLVLGRDIPPSEFRHVWQHSSLRWRLCENDDSLSLFAFHVDRDATTIDGVCPDNRTNWSTHLPSEEATRAMTRHYAIRY